VINDLTRERICKKKRRTGNRGQIMRDWEIGDEEDREGK
jgi:hypothetical protein